MEKYVAKWKGREIVLTVEDYEILLERFDIRNFEIIARLYRNKVICPLCKEYISEQCCGCTLDKFYSLGRPGCLEILDQIIEEIKTDQCLNLCTSQIIFSLEQKDEATKLINYVKGFLSTEFQLIADENEETNVR